MSSTCTTSPVDSSLAGVTPSVALHGHERPTHKRKGKAPPVDSFSGEDEAVRLDDWMPTLKRAATWKDWSEGDLLLQLAGRLRGRALQEWDLIPEDSPVAEIHLLPGDDLAEEQRKDSSLAPLIQYLTDGTLPQEASTAKLVVAKAPKFALLDKILYHVDIKQHQEKQAVVPMHLREKIMHEYHQGSMSGHFSGPRLYRTISRTWWWELMFTDIMHRIL